VEGQEEKINYLSLDQSWSGGGRPQQSAPGGTALNIWSKNIFSVHMEKILPNGSSYAFL
jgi:hypothetical protein